MKGRALKRYLGDAAEGQRAAAAQVPAAARQGLRLEQASTGTGAGIRRGKGRRRENWRVSPSSPALRPRPSRRPQRRAPRTATHALIRAAVAGATSARPQPAARAPAPAPAPRLPREWNVVCQTGRSARPAHGVGSCGESEARAQVQAQARRARPQWGRQLGKRRPAALQALSGRRGAPGTRGARRPARARARRPSPSPRAAAQLAAKLSPRPPAPGWRPAKLAAAPGRAAARPEGAPCAARAGPWPARPRRSPWAAGRESPGPLTCASNAPPRPRALPRARVGKLAWNRPDQFRPGTRTGRRKLLQNFFGGCSQCPPRAGAGCAPGRVPRADRGARREERGGGAPAPLPWGYGHGDRRLGRPQRRRRHERCG